MLLILGEYQYCPAVLIDRCENGILIPEQWRNGHTSITFAPIHQMESNFYSAEVKCTRNKLKNYFSCLGTIHVQNNRYY